MAPKKQYEEKHIKHLDDLEHIKAKPSMYLGECDTPMHAVKEVIDNAVDEHLAGHVNNVFVKWVNGKELFVADDGRGIPVGPHPKLKIPTLTAVFTRLHTGGKFVRDGEHAAYATSVGTHGVGVKATNALADSFEVWTFRDKKWWYQAFKEGIPVKKKPETVKGPPFKEGTFKKQGTQIRVVPSKKYFDSLKIDPVDIEDKVRDIAYLCPKLAITYQNGEKKPKVFHKKNGLMDFATGLLKADRTDKDIDTLHKEPISIVAKVAHKGKHLGQIEGAFLFTTNDEETSQTFVNVSYTPEAGAHYDGVMDALTDCIGKYGKKRDKYDPSFLRIGLYAVIHAKLTDPKFKSQTKDKLLSKAGEKDSIYEAVYPVFKKFFRKHKSLALDLIDKAIQMTEARDSYQEKKRALKGVKAKSGAKGLLPGKLAEAPWCKPEKRELFIVEGDSAAGSIKNARDATFQEVLPLRGKIINSMKNDLSKIMENAEIQAIVKSIGVDLKEDCKPEKSRVGKILILTDADPDGKHISALLMSFFAEFMAPVVAAGMVYSVDSPLFVGSHGDKRVFAHTLKKLKKRMKKVKLTDKAHISRLKGHGEANIEEVRDYAVNPETRRLYKMELNGNKDYRLIRSIMGEDTATRKKIIGIAA